MPGLKQGQIYSYPQKQWRKRKYQYLEYFMTPKFHSVSAETSNGDMQTISQVENPAIANTSTTTTNTTSTNGIPEDTADYTDDVYYDEDGFILDDELDAGEKAGNSDSDFEYGDTYSSRKKSKRGGRGRGRSKR